MILIVIRCAIRPLESWFVATFFFLTGPSEEHIFFTMLSKIIPLLALAVSADAHGYLTSPMSRTGLNAQVHRQAFSTDESETTI